MSDACTSCTVSDDHHDWRSCLKRMICQRNQDGEWETQPPGDPQDLLEGYQVNPCENCCRIVPSHSLDNCPHPEFSNYGVRFAIIRGARCVAPIRASQRSYLNGIVEIEALCPVCNWFIMRDVGGVVTYHNPQSCLKNCRMVLNEQGDKWVIKIDDDEEDESSLLSLCADGQHAHKSWQEYRKCYAELQEKYTYHQELRTLRGNTTHELCRVCVDIFADHAEAECPVGPGSKSPSLLEFWDNPVGSFVRFIGTMVEHTRGIQTGPCPLCKVQEDQHDYAACLQTVNLEMKEGELNVTTSGRKRKDPRLDPNPMGPTPRTTPKTMQPVPASKSPIRGTSGDPEDPDIIRGRYTCYRQPCTNCTDPFPSH